MKLLNEFVINLCKLSSCHWKVSIFLNDINSRFIRDHYASENIVLVLVIIGRIDERIYFILLFMFDRIKYKIGRIKHEIADLIALTSKTSLDELQHQPAQPRAWSKYLICFMKVLFSNINNLFVIFVLSAFIRPFPKELFNCGLNLTKIVEGNIIIPFKFIYLLMSFS